MIQDNSDEARTRPRHSHHYASAGDTTPCNPAFRTTRSIRVMATLILVTAFTFLVHKFDYDQLLSGLRPVTIAANSSEQPMTYSLHDENSLTIFIHDNPACLDKIPMLQVIFAAGMNLTSTLCNDLPPWRNVTDLYGEGPIVLGLETCQEYRDLISSHQGAEPRPKVAGLWNTGTTALSRNFNINMELYDDNGTVAAPTVTWGKHTPLRYKYLNTWPPSNKEDRDLILPVVITRDPYRWMDSMCTARYGAKWRSINKRCPNLIPTPEERRQYPDLGSTFVVNHTNYQAGYRFHTFYDSLAQMYSSWYNDYMNASFPRYVDLLQTHFSGRPEFMCIYLTFIIYIQPFYTRRRHAVPPGTGNDNVRVFYFLS